MPTGPASPAGAKRTAWRIFLTVWVIYSLHFASNVVRETYLAVALGDGLRIRVDEYVGLHPDLFVIEGRGAFINNNPGASILGAIPYAAVRPLIELLFRIRPELAAPKQGGEYEDPRPNRRRFFQQARARGLDIKLGLAAASMQVGLMAPLGALAAALLFLFLRERLGDARRAKWLALLYAFGTPIFFRSAFLNQNALVAHWVLFAYLLLASSRGERVLASSSGRLVGAGALLGLAVLSDYSAAPLAVVFGGWIAVGSWNPGRLRTAERGWRPAFRSLAWFAVGAAGPLAVLLGYQWVAFGNLLLPAQSYMPDTALGARGWHGVTLPSLELLWRNLFDPRFGLFVFSPMLAAAFALPFMRAQPGDPRRGELVFVYSSFLALYLFTSAIQFGLLQFNTGVRYLVPTVPLLFVALVPVLLRARPLVRYLLVVPTLAISWSASMAREDIPTSLAQVFLGGFRLPWLTVLEKTSSAYLPFLAGRASPLPLFVLTGVVLWTVWRGETSSPSTRTR